MISQDIGDCVQSSGRRQVCETPCPSRRDVSPGSDGAEQASAGEATLRGLQESNTPALPGGDRRATDGRSPADRSLAVFMGQRSDGLVPAREKVSAASPDLLLWAKRDGVSAPLPVLCHLLSTAACAGVLWDTWLREELRDLLGEAIAPGSRAASRALSLFFTPV